MNFKNLLLHLVLNSDTDSILNVSCTFQISSYHCCCLMASVLQKIPSDLLRRRQHYNMDSYVLPSATSHSVCVSHFGLSFIIALLFAAIVFTVIIFVLRVRAEPKAWEFVVLSIYHETDSSFCNIYSKIFQPFIFYTTSFLSIYTIFFPINKLRLFFPKQICGYW